PALNSSMARRTRSSSGGCHGVRGVVPSMSSNISASLAPVHPGRIRIDRPADGLDENPAAVGEHEPGGDPGREPARLRSRLHNGSADPILQSTLNMMRKLGPVESLSCCRGKYRMVRLIRQG